MKVNNTKVFKLAIYSVISIMFILSFRGYYYYQEMKSEIIIDAKKEAHLVIDYMMSMREVYQKQFIDSGMEVNKNNIGFLPAHASSLISDKFMQRNQDSFYIRNVSDQPRNISNMADKEEMKAIKYFNNDPIKTEYFRKYIDNKIEYFQYAKPIYIESYCISCHGKREETMKTIRDNYDTAYNYKVGDLRGVVSIKIPHTNLNKKLYAYIKKEAVISLLTLLIMVSIVIIIYRKVIFQIKDVKVAAENLALRDPLTGLYNRRYLETLDFDEKSFYSKEKEYVVAFLDIDHFKKVNDTYGHDMGDIVLKEFAYILINLTRKEDIVCRYGGEEFLIIANNISIQKAIQKFSNLIEKLEATSITLDEVSINITVSVGLSNGRTTDSLESVITNADSALYKAKSNGRNRVEVF